jgi:hypothetical protein
MPPEIIHLVAGLIGGSKGRGMNDIPATAGRLRQASGVFLFLALSELIPLLARYGVFSQWVLLLHVAVGVLAIVPLTWIFWKHRERVRTNAMVESRYLGSGGLGPARC